MTLHAIALDSLLAVTVFACWVGVLGMWRMKTPIQALHYVSMPASLGILMLCAAVFVEAGNSSVSWKMLLIAGVVLSINAVVGHATGRAFRTRELGHWQPRNRDPIEFVRQTEGQ